jgi:putative tryptophan/tyrosine transport system substrate-binding protein
MRRREFLTLLISMAAAAPRAARAQQPAMPVVGFLRSTPAEPFAHLVTAFRQGLNDAGFVEGENVAIEYRWADNQLDRLPDLATDLVHRQVAAIVGNSLAVLAAKVATATIPLVFVAADDPVKGGLVDSLSRPRSNVTGVTFFGGGQLNAKRMELLRDLVPQAAVIAVLIDPHYPAAEAELPNVVAAGQAIGRQIVVVRAANEREFDTAFATILQAGAGALLVSGSPVFTSQRRHLVTLAVRHAIPAVYDQREFVISGGLISYAASVTDAYRRRL